MKLFVSGAGKKIHTSFVMGVFLSVLLFVAIAQADSIVDEVQSVAWTESNHEYLQSVLKDKEKVQELVEATRITTGDAEVPGNVGDYRLLDFSNDGQLELIVTMDYSGRGFYGTFYVYTCKNGKLQRSMVETGGIEIDLLKNIVDLKHDGKKELLAARLLELYAGARDVATFTDVYKYDKGTFIKADLEFSEYYRTNRLPELNNLIKKSKEDMAYESPQERDLTHTWLKSLEKEKKAIYQCLNKKLCDFD